MEGGVLFAVPRPPSFCIKNEVQILHFGDFLCTNLWWIILSAGFLIRTLFDALKIFTTMLSNCLPRSCTTFFSPNTHCVECIQPSHYLVYYLAWMITKTSPLITNSRDRSFLFHVVKLEVTFVGSLTCNWSAN